MLKLVTIVGARPQIIKAAALSRAIDSHFSDKIQEILVHTGQHYDEEMSGSFFSELGLPEAKYHFSGNESSAVRQMAAMLTGIEEVLTKERPSAVVVYGDTNSTLATAIVCSKMNIPLVHIEAGLRSFNKEMPEEINRISCDHASTVLFTPTQTGYNHLKSEGIVNGKKPYSVTNPAVYQCGDVMYDNSLHFANLAEKKSDVLKKSGLEKNDFLLATIHRNYNTDAPARLSSLFNALLNLAKIEKIILPLHPRTKKCMQDSLPAEMQKAIQNEKNLILCEPLPFLDIIQLEKNCSMVLTDSGGIQKEAFFFQKPCLILRPETEWVELVECGAATLTDADPKEILDAYSYYEKKKDLKFPSVFGDGRAAEFICKKLLEVFA
jgi:UDP-GlcNAc3NAcA epimerase